jgi:fumarylacetoacetate (FAA) hydrolase
MRLVTFRGRPVAPAGRPPVAPPGEGAADRDGRGGLVLGDEVVDLATALSWLDDAAGRTRDPAAVEARYGRGILGFVEHVDLARPAADAVARAHADGSLPRVFEGAPVVHAGADVTLLAPIPRPPSVRDGYAFRQHVETARRNRGLPMIPEFDAFPVFYFTNHRAIVGPGEVRVREKHLDRLDYELEAAVVVGRTARDLTAQTADDAIFGMTIMNDWSARGLQMEEMKLNLGPAKGKDFATSLGPWLVTLDELLPHARPTDRGLMFDLAMRASVNGQLLSQGNVADMTWTFAQLLERASYGVELAPGDVIGSGTCGTGCLLELNGSGVTTDLWLSEGDVVVLEIDGLGRLENRIVT